jgi:hypothetical protein
MCHCVRYMLYSTCVTGWGYSVFTSVPCVDAPLSLSLSLGAGSVQNSHITDSTTSQVLDMSVRLLMDLWNSEAPETRQELGDIAKDLLLIVRESVHMFHFIHRKEVG